MIKPVIQYINLRLGQLNIFTQLNELTEILRIDKRTFPAIYCRDGEYFMPEWDNTKAEVYHRLLSQSQTQGDDSDVGCDDSIIKSYSMRVVAFVPKNIYNSDDKYISQKVAENISNIISNSNIQGLAINLKADYVSVTPSGYDIDGEDVWKTEFTGIEYGLHSNYMLISVDYTIEIKANSQCFVIYDCNDQEIVIPGVPILPDTCCYDDDMAKDAVGQMFEDGDLTGLTIDYNSISKSITIVITGGGGGLTCNTLGACTIITNIQALLPTVDQKAALNAANLPAGLNPFATIADIPATFIISILDTPSVDLLVALGVLTADVKISATAGNIISINADGIYAPTPSSDFITSILDTATIDLDVTAGVLTANFINAAGYITTVGGTTVGNALLNLTNPSAITFIRINADNSVDALSAANFRIAIGAEGITIGTTAIASGTANRLLYETSGNVAGEISGATSDGTNLFVTTQTEGDNSTKAASTAYIDGLYYQNILRAQLFS